MALMLPIHHKVRAGLVDPNVISPMHLFENSSAGACYGSVDMLRLCLSLV
jgi:hypothetical protein